jgi:hypothetical protein
MGSGNGSGGNAYALCKAVVERLRWYAAGLWIGRRFGATERGSVAGAEKVLIGVNASAESDASGALRVALEVVSVVAGATDESAAVAAGVAGAALAAAAAAAAAASEDPAAGCAGVDGLAVGAGVEELPAYGSGFGGWFAGSAAGAGVDGCVALDDDASAALGVAEPSGVRDVLLSASAVTAVAAKQTVVAMAASVRRFFAGVSGCSSAALPSWPYSQPSVLRKVRCRRAICAFAPLRSGAVAAASARISCRRRPHRRRTSGIIG